MNRLYIILAFMCLALQSCFDDKGNYTYSGVNEITIEGILPEYGRLGNVDSLKITPVVTSSLEGVIDGNNPNYIFTYEAAVKSSSTQTSSSHQRFLLDSAFHKDLAIFSSIQPQKYVCWFGVEDKRTGIKTRKQFELNISSATSEGWMVLCNDLGTGRVRMDMLTVISEDRIVKATNLLATLGLPSVSGAYSLGWDPNSNIGAVDDIYVFTSGGGYKLEPETFKTSEQSNVLYEFGDRKGNCRPVSFGATTWNKFVVTEDNNAFCMVRSVPGAIYQLPINTTRANTLPEFKVSPYFAVDAIVDYTQNTSAIFYDIDNKRFAAWMEYNASVILPLENPEGEEQKFDYATGKDLVYMGATQYADGTAFALLKDDAGNFSIYGIAFVFKSFQSEIHQQSYVDVTAPELERATSFAFHSMYPYFFYAVDNKVYEYDMVNKTTEQVVLLSDQEKISMIKFNLFKNEYDDKPDSFLNQQYDLIVGTVDSRITGTDKGVLRFYNVPGAQQKLVLKGEPRTGFGKIIDVVYRERF